MKRFFSVILTPIMAAPAGMAQDSIAMQHNLEDVVIAAVRPAASAPITFFGFDRDAIARHNYGQDIPYLAALAPSAVYTSDAGAGIGYTGMRIRGSAAERINITLNGIPLNDAESHSVFWVNMPDLASSLQSMQIVRGAGASTNGAAAFGASVNMQTETLHAAPYAEYSGTYGAFSTLKNTIKAGTGLLKNRYAIDLRLSEIRTDGYIDRASASMQSYYIGMGYYGVNNMLKFLTYAGKEKTYQAWDGVPADMLGSRRTYNPCGFMYEKDGYEQYYPNQTDNYQQMNYQLFYTHQFSAAWNFHAALHYTYGSGYYEDYKPKAKIKEYLLPIPAPDTSVHDRTDLIRQKLLKNHFYGGTFSLNYVKNNLTLTFGGAASYYDGGHYGKVNWAQGYGVLNTDYYDNTGTKFDANIFAKLDMHLWKGLHAYADGQFRYIDYRISGADDKVSGGRNVMLAVNEKYPFFNPKAGLYYMLNSVNEIYASFATAHREPQRSNFTEAGANEHPTHERLYDYELGYKYNGRRLQAAFNLYYMDYQNQLILTGKISEVGKALTANIPRSMRSGIELQAGVSIAQWLRWDGNAAFSMNKLYDFVEYVDDWDDVNGGQQVIEHGAKDIAFSPNVVVNSMFSFEWKGFSANLRSAYVGRQYLDNTSSEQRSIAAYFVNNAAVGYAFKLNSVNISIDLLCNNIFNAQYESNGWVYSYYSGGERRYDIGYFPQAGRHFLGRVAIKM